MLRFTDSRRGADIACARLHACVSSRTDMTHRSRVGDGLNFWLKQWRQTESPA